MTNRKKILLIIGVILFFAVATAQWYWVRQQSLLRGENSYPESNFVYRQADTVIYEGKEGVDALTLLKETVVIKQNESGLVTVINGREARDEKKEFWAFYVNGEMATVGPEEYITQKGDRIEWKIETY